MRNSNIRIESVVRVIEYLKLLKRYCTGLNLFPDFYEAK